MVGGARLSIVLHDTGEVAALQARSPVATGTGRTIRQVVGTGSFERVTSFGLGVRARLPFQAFVLPGPGGGSRLVVDVAHAWCAGGAARC